MDEKYLWPLVGVFLGWMLTVVSASFRGLSDKRKLIGNLLAKLIRVQRHLRLLTSSSERLKDIAGSWANYEVIRASVYRRHFLEPESVRNDLAEAIDAIAPIYPILAIDIDGMFETLLKNKAADMAGTSKDEETYIRMLSVYEVGLDLSTKELGRIVNKLALRHGIITYVRVKFSNWKGARNLKSAEGTMANFAEEFRAGLERLQGGAATVSPPKEDSPEDQS